MKSQNKILEGHVRKAIKDFLTYQGWEWWWHLNQGVGVYRGLSDLEAIKNGITLYIEVKSPTGKQNSDQIKFEEKIKRGKGLYILARSVEDVNDYICKNFWDTGILF